MSVITFSITFVTTAYVVSWLLVDGAIYNILVLLMSYNLSDDFENKISDEN